MSREQDLRDLILFGEPYVKDKYHGGVRYFNSLIADEMQDLINHGFLDLESCQNNSPTTEQFLDFMEEWPGYYAHGYAVCFERSDVRVTIEGISKGGSFIERDELIAFMQKFRYADELTIEDDNLRCWYD